MSQEQLNLIVKILQNGAPALANELIDSIVKVVNGYANVSRELEVLKAAKSDRAENEKESK